MDDRFTEILKTRRTVGAFRAEPVPWDVVARAIELACWAPNHRKTEPWRFHWLGSETARAVVDLNASLIAMKKGPAEAESKRKQWSAVPGWIAITCLRNDDAFLQEEDYAACCCAVQNLMLALWNHGVGTKWSTGDVTRHPEFFRLLGVDPTEQRSVGMIWYGYPATVPEQTRRPVTDVLRQLP
jgi:nitroreductase